MVRMTIGVAMIAAMLSGTSAIAQETGTLITHAAAQVDYRDKNAARLLTNRWATCVVHQSPGHVEAYLALPTGSKASRSMAGGFLDGESSCLSGSVESRVLDVDDQVTRGALFEALYKRKFGRLAADIAAVPPQKYDWPGQDMNANAQQATALAQVGDCVVRKDAADARTLMFAEPGGNGESQAMGALVPLLGGCLPNGKQYTFSKTLVRGLVAEPLYKLSLAATGAHK